MIDFSVTGDNDIPSNLRAKATSIIETLAQKVDAVDQMLVAKIQSNLGGAVLNMQSGKLHNSVRALPVEVSADTITGVVTAGGDEAPYGVYHEVGTTRAYQIIAVNKKVLSFMADGKRVFAKSVTHPPIVQRVFVQSAVDELRDEINYTILSAMEYE